LWRNSKEIETREIIFSVGDARFQDSWILSKQTNQNQTQSKDEKNSFYFDRHGGDRINRV
jgi:hypothetical protein